MPRATGMVFSDVSEAHRAYSTWAGGRPARRVKVRIRESTSDGDDGELESSPGDLQGHETTVGRALLSEILPAGSLRFVNSDAEEEGDLRADQQCYRQVGLKETVIFADQLMYTGFSYATSGRHLHRCGRHGDPRGEGEHPSDARRRAEVKEIEDQYASGLVTDGERYNKVVDIWTRTSDQVAKAMMASSGHRRSSPTPTARRSSRVLQLDLHDG